MILQHDEVCKVRHCIDEANEPDMGGNQRLLLADSLHSCTNVLPTNLKRWHTTYWPQLLSHRVCKERHAAEDSNLCVGVSWPCIFDADLNGVNAL